MLESRSKAQKTQTRVWIPMKTSAKHFGLAVGLQAGQLVPNDPKTTSLMTSVTKNPHLPTKKIFFKCNLLDWSILLSHSTAL